MNAGRIEQVGAPSELYQRPASLFVGRFLGELNAFPLQALEGSAARIAGARLLLADPPAQLPADPRLCIRPAAVLVGAEAQGRENLLAMRVAGTSFLGDAVRLSLEGEGPKLLADVPFTRLGRIPAVGEPMAAALPAAQLMVLPGGG
jgi:ABC-type Fe3+/spermidine/putrescine transport system ATPase subunit